MCTLAARSHFAKFGANFCFVLFVHQVHSTAADRDKRGTDPVDSMDSAMSVEDKEDLAHLALHIAATSGFVEGIYGIQTSCLRLCNACRESVPVQLLKISDPVPRSIAALVYPGLRQPEKEESSRVLLHRWVLSIHWTFSDAHILSLLDGTKAQIIQETSDATDLVVVGHVDLSQVQWPQGTREIALLGNFNRRVDEVPWPSGLERLWFEEPNRPSPQTHWRSDVFDIPLDGVTFPCGLREILLGDRFDQPIEGIAWPGGLERLSLPGFNHSIKGVQWPPGLKALEFLSPSRIRQWQDAGPKVEAYQYLLQGQGYFNQVLGNSLPPSLERLWLSGAYSRNFDGVAWPNGIVTLGFPFYFRSENYRRIKLPPSVKTIFLLDKVDTGIRFPDGIEVKILNPYGERSN